MNIRVGQGYDVHRLVEGRKLVLGGVDIPYELGLLGHSDAGADSRVLLRGAVALLKEKGWRPVNVDATIVAQQPKLAPYAAAMVANVAVDLGISPDSVNIKGKTNEKLGYLGRSEAIEAQAVVLIVRD